MKQRSAIPVAAICFLFCFIKVPTAAQYFYHDILNPQTTAKQLKTYKQAKVRKVLLHSFDADGTPLKGFVGVQELSPAYNQMKTFTQTGPAQQSVVISHFNYKTQLIRSTDSSNTGYKTIQYTYTDDGLLQRVEINSGTYATKERERELHIWQFENGFAQRMWLVRKGTDSTEIRFLPDENGWVGEEEWWKKGNLVEKYYYYYDTAGRLTDIVRFHEKARRLLPDHMFAYDAAGRLAEWIIVNTATGDYTTWRYSYNSKMLREKDACYNKKKQLLGWIAYSYE